MDSPREWIATVASWPAEFEYRSMVDTSIELSKRLRDPDGEYKCDVIIALTHCRHVELLVVKTTY